MKNDVIVPSKEAKETIDEILDMLNEPGAMEELDTAGVCYHCGDMPYGVEPDAEMYKCEACGHPKVMGLLTAVLGVGVNI